MPSFCNKIYLAPRAGYGLALPDEALLIQGKPTGNKISSSFTDQGFEPGASDGNFKRIGFY